MPSETRTSLISLFGSIVVHSFPTVPRPRPRPRPGGAGALVLIDLCRADFQNSPNECERTSDYLINLCPRLFLTNSWSSAASPSERRL